MTAADDFAVATLLASYAGAAGVLLAFGMICGMSFLVL